MQFANPFLSSGRMAKALLASCLALVGMNTSNAQLLFTQYYEGASFNKWIEFKNVGSTSIDLSQYSLSIYTNAAAENWKVGTAGTAFGLTGTLAANTTYVMAHGSAALPYASSGANLTNNTIVNFNGNDSVVLWNDSSAFSTAQIVDVLSFTNSGNEGVDKSFVRSSLNVGYNLTTGSDMTEFTSVWTQISLSVANAAVAGTDDYLGYSSMTAAAIPEPSTYAAIFGGLAMVGAVVYRRRQAKKA